MILFGFSIGALAPWILGVIGDKRLHRFVYRLGMCKYRTSIDQA
jgi:hypothetical protein